MKTVRYPDLAKLLRGYSGPSQREIADNCGVSQPTVSAWFSGRKRPDRAHTAYLAKALGIPAAGLAAAAGHSQIPLDFEETGGHRQGIDAILHHVAGLLHQIKAARDSGMPQLALNLCDLVGTLLDKWDHSLTGNLQREAYRLHGDVLAHKGRIFCECLAPSDAVAEMKRIAYQLDELADRTDNPEFSGLAMTTNACIQYIRGQHRRSLSLNIEAQEYIEDPGWKLDVTRAIAISAGSLKMPGLVEDQERQIKRLLDTSQDQDKQNASFAFEGLGRAYAFLGRDAALGLIERAKQLHEQASVHSPTPRRTIQLLRSQAIALSNCPASGARERSDIINEAITLANLHRLIRYSLELAKIGNAA